MTETTQTPRATGHIWRWRAATVVCLLLLAIGTATGMSMYEQLMAQIKHLQTKLKTTSQIRYIAVLQDAQQAPALLITLDTQDTAMQIQRLNSVAAGPEDSMQLWALSANGQPRSLGVLESAGKTLRLPASDKTLADVAELAISVENKGGVEPNRGPRLPYLFKGAVVQKAL